MMSNNKFRFFFRFHDYINFQRLVRHLGISSTYVCDKRTISKAEFGMAVVL